MKEQSHKDEMSAALRGDFARLRDRGVAATLAPTVESAVPEPSEPSEPFEPAPVLEHESETVAGLEPAEPAADDEDGLDVSDVEPAVERSGWLDRLLGR